MHVTFQGTETCVPTAAGTAPTTPRSSRAVTRPPTASTSATSGGSGHRATRDQGQLRRLPAADHRRSGHGTTLPARTRPIPSPPTCAPPTARLSPPRCESWPLLLAQEGPQHAAGHGLRRLQRPGPRKAGHHDPDFCDRLTLARSWVKIAPAPTKDRVTIHAKYVLSTAHYGGGVGQRITWVGSHNFTDNAPSATTRRSCRSPTPRSRRRSPATGTDSGTTPP